MRRPARTLPLLLALAAACRHAPAATVGEPLPGAAPFERALADKLAAAWAARDPGYPPRTRHLRADGSPRFTNRLFLEASPYLRQHAHNPVNWYSWGDEAFDAARRLGRPVLLSIGYSTCHWCHVMEEESFEDEEIARFLNQHYVAVKVDREERPDVDAVYMSAVEMLTNGGGWPMTVWLTPERRPFYGGTYFPPRDGARGARLGFLSLLKNLDEEFKRDPLGVAARSERIARSIRDQLGGGRGGDLPTAGLLDEAALFYRNQFDWSEGGLLRAPKFPSSLPIVLLLRDHLRTGNADSLKMATITLEKMAAGGIYDQVGGGFHRYATDSHWLVPHFEKMLYDNALLAVAYLEGYQATGRRDFADVAREILRFTERDMRSADGAFYSATDADSPAPGGRREEGRFFTWTPDELAAAVGPERARVVGAYYGVSAAGNFEGRTILHRARPLADVARELGLAPEAVAAIVEPAREELHAQRAARPPPLRDDKILAGWNGLMISAFARASLVLADERYAAVAGRAADFIWTHLFKDGRLLRSWEGGQARHDGDLEDHAFLVAGFLDLFQAGGNARWFAAALALDRALADHFEDRASGGFFLTSDEHAAPIARDKPAFDGAEPSGNSVAALDLLRLHAFTADDRYRERAERTLRAFGGQLARSPASLSQMLLAVDFALSSPKEIVIAVPHARAEAEPFLARLRARHFPRCVLAVRVATDGDKLDQLIPILKGKLPQKGNPTAYVCERGSCQLPTSDPESFARQLDKASLPQPH